MSNAKPCDRRGCRRWFEPQRSTGRFCSPACRVAHHRATKRELARHDWHTPAEIVEAARLVLGDIDLDPASCALANDTVRAARFYSPREDGLRQSWQGRVWLNPPYGRHVGSWVAKLLAEYASGAVPVAVTLLPARTDTRWFSLLDGWPRCFIAARLHFNGALPPPFPSCAVYLGANADRFGAVFGEFGRIWQLKEATR